MISTEELSLSFGGNTLFSNVNVKFLKGNCYGLIGANGAGKSTFLKILSGSLPPSSGSVSYDKKLRIAILKQDHFAYEDSIVLDTVLMGHHALYQVHCERNALYSKAEMTDAEGIRSGELEVMYGEMGGYEAESEAASRLKDLGISESYHAQKMGSLDAGQKIKVLLAQALFGNPDILLLDEPTNQLDYISVLNLERFLAEFENTVIVVSHDRHFLNKVCTHVANLDFKKLTVHVGNYDFWEQSSKLAAKQKGDLDKKNSDKIKELKEFIARFSANASKSKQATSRKKLIDKLTPEDICLSSRKSPFMGFKAGRECGRQVLDFENVSHSIDGEKVLNNVTFRLQKDDKVALIGQNTLAKTTLLKLLAGEIEPDSGTIAWGPTIVKSYFPKDNTRYFDKDYNLLDWLSQYSKETDLQIYRGLLGRMLFSGDDVYKSIKVLSGGEKARAMFSKIMLSDANVLLFDEPTDHLDLESISALNEGLARYNSVLILTSHDFELLNTTTNRIIEITDDGSIIDQKTSFEEYINSQAEKNQR